MRAYPQVAKPILELILGATVIISMQHPQEQALAKTARADEDEIYRLILQQWQVHRLVYIVIILFDNLYEVAPTVWYSYSLVP